MAISIVRVKIITSEIRDIIPFVTGVGVVVVVVVDFVVVVGPAVVVVVVVTLVVFAPAVLGTVSVTIVLLAVWAVGASIYLKKHRKYKFVKSIIINQVFDVII